MAKVNTTSYIGRMGYLGLGLIGSFIFVHLIVLAISAFNYPLGFLVFQYLEFLFNPITDYFILSLLIIHFFIMMYRLFKNMKNTSLKTLTLRYLPATFMSINIIIHMGYTRMISPSIPLVMKLPAMIYVYGIRDRYLSILMCITAFLLWYHFISGFRFNRFVAPGWKMRSVYLLALIICLSGPLYLSLFGTFKGLYIANAQSQASLFSTIILPREMYVFLSTIPLLIAFLFVLVTIVVKFVKNTLQHKSANN